MFKQKQKGKKGQQQKAVNNWKKARRKQQKEEKQQKTKWLGFVSGLVKYLLEKKEKNCRSS